MGVHKVSLPFKGKRKHIRTEYERQPWFRRLQRWRAGQEGTIQAIEKALLFSDRTLYWGHAGCRRWVGGVIWGYNLNRIAKLL